MKKMKKILLIISLFAITVGYGQKVMVENHVNEIVIASVEKSEVEKHIEKLPDGIYKVTELKASLVNGKWKFKVCRYEKKSFEIHKI